MIDAFTRRWRWPIYGLLVYLPVSGVAVLAAYPGRIDRAVAILAKDFVFVIPAYVLFAGYCLLHRKRFWFKGAPLVLFGLLALIVVVQAFNPDLPNHLVGLIGIKVWLFYIPLFFLGYWLVENRAHLFRLLGLMSLVALVPAVIALVEVVLYYAGHSQTVYDVYGDAASAATQGFTTFMLAHGCTLRRVPSTFSFFYQYYLFGAAMVAVSFAWWRGSRPAGKQLWGGGVVFVVIFVAALFSGVRLGFLAIPLLVAAIIVLAIRSSNRLSWAALAAGVACFAIVGGTAAGICGLAAHLGAATTTESKDLGPKTFSEAVHKTWLGLGAGSDSTAARYAFPNVELQTAVGNVKESWYVKAYLELGVFGLAAALALLGTIMYRAGRIHFRLRDPRLKMVSAAILALMAWVLLYSLKAQYFDLDPINIYFWLFAGILMGLPRLDRRETVDVPQPVAELVPVKQ
jgi:hypothetical protein